MGKRSVDTRHGRWTDDFWKTAGSGQVREDQDRKYWRNIMEAYSRRIMAVDKIRNGDYQKKK